MRDRFRVGIALVAALLRCRSVRVWITVGGSLRVVIPRARIVFYPRVGWSVLRHVSWVGKVDPHYVNGASLGVDDQLF